MLIASSILGLLTGLLCIWIVRKFWFKEKDSMATIFSCAMVLFASLTIEAAITYVNSPDLVTLKKFQWQCTVSHTEIIWGKTPTYIQVCDQYNRK